MGKNKKLMLFVAALAIAIYFGNGILRNMYPLNHYDIIRENAAKHDLDPLFIASVIHAESRFAEDATSHKEAKGLMQIQEKTALWCAEQMRLDDFDTEKIYMPEYNILIGAWYFHYLLDEFDGDYTLTLAAYNAGMGNVKEWLDNTLYSKDGTQLDKIPFAETERYIKKVKNNHAIYKMLY